MRNIHACMMERKESRPKHARDRDLHIDLTLVHSQSKATDLIRASLYIAILSIVKIVGGSDLLI
jgi:hypothetical protein